jgi:quercetin dioxygenase-like cupin family protein
MRTKLLIAAVLALLVSLGVGVGIGTATESKGLVSELLARGAAGKFRIDDQSNALRIVAKKPTDIAFVKATLERDGYTGWHGHPGPSLVIVNKGTLTMLEPHHRRCASHTFGPGQAFVHPEGRHNFVAGAEGAEFYVAYFVPAGAAPLLIDVPAVPKACA